ncbi:spore coat polysaccharide biosynthesis protein SpsF (cytidylyltransferase family) [Fluviicoccus keumensis]|uniref:Spore coat polysaccharide biosynthesis protein SpsF (Cytidylyltransferase family) n=1 Tax=Fluviicoccus keumensis TaxID=1435465 RepID=A0A4Q7ZBD0_9GAMM|nr:hypothetical protein [Fluviicoccus keumensis]RZU47273.1 spore coat polysaccharide biosynthesis protein SpsF (cytidylyltransferase family) [Fluviicoccus keumensis]
MKQAILVTARLGSSRLPRKHLIRVGELSFLSCLLRRLLAIRWPDGQVVPVVIVTSDEPENRDFEQFVCEHVSVFYGSLHNIPLRHAQAAEALGLDGIIAVDGDDILCSPEAVRAVGLALREGRELVRTQGLPFGMNAMGYSGRLIRACAPADPDGMCETGWGSIFPADAWHDIALDVGVPADECRLTLDYPEDSRFFTEIISRLQAEGSLDTATDRHIVERVKADGLTRLNQSVHERYWENFHQEKAKATRPEAP